MQPTHLLGRKPGELFEGEKLGRQRKGGDAGAVHFQGRACGLAQRRTQPARHGSGYAIREYRPHGGFIGRVETDWTQALVALLQTADDLVSVADLEIGAPVGVEAEDPRDLALDRDHVVAADNVADHVSGAVLTERDSGMSREIVDDKGQPQHLAALEVSRGPSCSEPDCRRQRKRPERSNHKRGHPTPPSPMKWSQPQAERRLVPSSVPRAARRT